MDGVKASRPTVASSGAEQSSVLWPREVRLRNLTYAASIYVGMTQTSVHIKGNESDDAVSKSMDIRLCTVCILEICHE